MKDLLRRARRWWLRPVENALEKLALEQGRQWARALPGPGARLREAEFSVFSQNGEDGAIQWLLRHVAVADRSFVEFGVQDYRESNTRFLLMKDLWRGWIIDADGAHQRYVHKESFLGQDRDLQALKAFITRENIEAILEAAGVPEDLGLLSVDIDGNDYWVLEAIRRVRPRVLVAEYNGLFGPELAVSLPYDPGFRRLGGIERFYFGASLRAITDLASGRGYALVGCESRGSNAFFVRRELLGGLAERSVEEAFVPLLPGSGLDQRKVLAALAGRPLVETASGRTAPLGHWFGA